jgi:hypothetical protein
MSSNTLTILSIILLIFAFISTIYSIYLFNKIRQIKTLVSENNHPENLEHILLAITANIKTLEKRIKSLEEHKSFINTKISTVFQKSGLVRYNAYGNEGGHLSFSLILLNDIGNGFCITSIHGRDQNRTYVKNIINNKPEQTLSQEEQDSLKQAINS